MTPASTTTSSTHDRVEGKVHEVKGEIKQKVADIKKDPNLHDEGTSERISGTVERKVGDVKKVFEK